MTWIKIMKLTHTKMRTGNIKIWPVLSHSMRRLFPTLRSPRGLEVEDKMVFSMSASKVEELILILIY